MISLDIQEYCSNCLDFEPYVSTYKNQVDTDTFIVNTIIKCAYAKRCKSIKRYLERACTEDSKNEKEK